MASAWGNSWGKAWANAWGRIAQIDTHDGGDYYYRWWKKQHGKKKPTSEEVIAAVVKTPKQALQAVPEAKKKFNIDYRGLQTNLEAQIFIAKKIQIFMEIKRLREEEEAIELLLLVF